MGVRCWAPIGDLRDEGRELGERLLAARSLDDQDAKSQLCAVVRRAWLRFSAVLPRAQTEEVTDRVGVDPELVLRVEMPCAKRDGAFVCRFEVIHR
jgi:hypothetical protein